MKKFWNTKSVAKNSAELCLYGDISETTWWGDEVTPKQFADDLAALGDIELLSVRINSGGGDVFAGMAIHSMLKRHKAQVHVYVDGLAASIASIVAMAGDRIVMPKGSMMMVHNPWSFTWGDANEMRTMADVLDKIRDAMVEVYMERTSKSREDIIALLDAETWMTATEAVEHGFAHEVESSQIAARLRNGVAIVNGLECDWSKFKRAPKLPEASDDLSKLSRLQRELDLKLREV